MAITQQEVNEAVLAWIHHSEWDGFARVLDAIRQGEVTLTVTEEGMELRVVKREEA